MNFAASVRQAQRRWAQTTNRALDRSGYCLQLNDNLLAPLSPQTRVEFLAGDGAELGPAGGRGKLQAVHSSSALACNFFDHWWDRAGEPLRNALGLTPGIVEVRFERKFGTGIGPRQPNLDVVLELQDDSLVAIESKFLEPYTGDKRGKGIQDKYFPSGGTGCWARAGLLGCQRLAEAIRSGQPFRYLDAPQLLKHMLGLANQARPWTLLYLWFDPPGEPSRAHGQEVLQFHELLGQDGARFRGAGYGQIFANMFPTLTGEHRDYAEYLRIRYLAHAVTG